MELVIGGLYQHYKGKRYRVVSIARHSETLEKVVVYEAEYEDIQFGKVWVRPLDMFCEVVEYNGETVPRFKLIK